MTPIPPPPGAVPEPPKDYVPDVPSVAGRIPAPPVEAQNHAEIPAPPCSSVAVREICGVVEGNNSVELTTDEQLRAELRLALDSAADDFDDDDLDVFLDELANPPVLHDDTGPVSMTQQEIDKFMVQCRTDFLYFAPRGLYIKTKAKGLASFQLNPAQQYLHQVAEQMIEDHGMVRIIVVKGRQQGISTYVEGRFYWRAIHHKGVKVYILTHEGSATKNLFEMANRYHQYCPPDLQPIVGKDNANELEFKELESKYTVGTAGSKGTGRSQTMQYFHGSEVAYWPNAESHSSGVMEGIPDEPGTEVFLESTAAGFGDYFHSVWQHAADPGAKIPPKWNGYIRVFIPWWWQPEYRSPVPSDFEMNAEEQVYAHNNRNQDGTKLSPEQIYWRRKKIAKMKGRVELFQKDYPATPDEAFNAGVNDILIQAPVVQAARRRFEQEYLKGQLVPYGPIVIGVDVAREGDDATTIAVRQGRVVLDYQQYWKQSTMQTVGRVVRAFEELGADHAFIDGVGVGAGVVDRLIELGYGDRITEIKGNHVPLDEDQYQNKRSEMWDKMREWLEEGGAIPDEDAIQMDLCSLKYTFTSTGNKLELESKKKAKERGIKSPDIGDAIGFTFAQPVTKISLGRDYVEPDY